MLAQDPARANGIAQHVADVALPGVGHVDHLLPAEHGAALGRVEGHPDHAPVAQRLDAGAEPCQLGQMPAGRSDENCRHLRQARLLKTRRIALARRLPYAGLEAERRGAGGSGSPATIAWGTSCTIHSSRAGLIAATTS